jgi:hypothetical protein
MTDRLSLKVAARFQRRADEPTGAREHARVLTKPINAPRGIAQSIVDQNGSEMEPGHDETLEPNRKDIQPKDVFNLTPNNGGVLNLAQTGNDLQNAVQTKVPRDQGYDTVYNLSQYLIRTNGGGDTGPAGSQ